MKDKIGLGTAIGKIILIGEHSVVYGQAALAIPYGATKIKTTIFRKDGPVFLDCFFYYGLLSHGPEKLLGLTSLIKEVVGSFNEELKDFSIRIESSIPAERGMVPVLQWPLPLFVPYMIILTGTLQMKTY